MNENIEETGVAIFGCGTVGGATASILSHERAWLTKRLGMPLALRHVVDIRFDRAKDLGLDESLFTTEHNKALSDPRVSVVVETIGGLNIAKEVIEKALRAGKHVVTANKALLAHEGASLFALARENGVCLAFEASCGGGIPIIRALIDGLIANRIDAIYGIVNGTCNYILTEMVKKGRAYADVLAEAQAKGYAEADPTLDVSGIDSAHKIAIMAAIAFGQRISLDAIAVSGIDALDPSDVAFGETLGYVVKLLAIAERREDGVCLRVRPSFISEKHPLAWVSGPFNAISVYGHATGHTMYYGRGAGDLPTASAVVADIASLAVGNAQRLFNKLGCWPDRCPSASLLPAEAILSRYYLRMTCEDRPGVLAQVAAILSKKDIGIASVLQHEAQEDKPQGVPVVLTTHRALEGNVRLALAEVDALPVVKAPTVCLGIVDEREESFTR